MNELELKLLGRFLKDDVSWGDMQCISVCLSSILPAACQDQLHPCSWAVIGL